MPGKTIYLSTSDFNDQGILEPSGVRCNIKNAYFRKGDSLNNQEIKKVLDICQKYHQFGINTLIVRNNEELTIWIEDKLDKNQAQNQQQNIKSPNDQLPTKTVIRRYRGQVYEETVVDWAAIQQSNPQNKPRRKYRGQYID